LIRVQFFFTLLKINSFTSYVMDLWHSNGSAVS
jgi:hypothetical protein